MDRVRPLLRGFTCTPPDSQDVYCLQGRTWGYPGNCQFSTYSQCMATASGTYAYCGINPIYAFLATTKAIALM
ncbi:DUF3551 domain-containing protein [Bradyrhizobium yuanmingense]|uniref:DUF3551 domain-containing protein n=1 Tax=Bradyrhizobium yuanmingense TaxID=108015 RepID=UPI003CC5F0AE